DRPLTLVSDPAVVDPGRVRGGLRPLWAYAHAPAGDRTDPTERVTAQIERFAPGFRDLVVASRAVSAAEMIPHNPALAGGDLSQGRVALARMVVRATPVPVPDR